MEILVMSEAQSNGMKRAWQNPTKRHNMTICQIGRKHKESSKHLMSIAHKGKKKSKEFGMAISKRTSFENNVNWKGGKRLTKDGYVRICIGSGNTILEHKLVAEKALGRKMKSSELVHHINGDRTDNRNQNLLICDRKYHGWLNAKMTLLYQREHFQ